jgi:hypothetical protein
MKTLLTFLFAFYLCSSSLTSLAQCNGRYYDEVFTGPEFTVNVPGLGQIPDLAKLGQSRVVYGNAEGQSLDMYVFQPEGDTAAKRPLIVLAYGGSFTAGVKESPDIINLCQAFTLRGFVTASISYRLLQGQVDSASMLKQAVKAVQDAKAAIRYFYKDAATSNTYRIDTNKIFMGGTSAGAFIGVHLGYLTDTIGLQQWMKQIIESQGDIEGNSGNPGYSSRVSGIINLAGAIGDTAWIKPGAVPMVSMHGNDDGTVPYCSKLIAPVNNVPIIVVDGSATIKRRTANLGIVNRFYTWRDAGHVPYVDPRPTTSGPAYMDTTVWFVRDFLFEQITGIRCDSVLWAAGHVTQPQVYENNVLVSCGSEIVDPTDAKPFNTSPSTGIAIARSSPDFSIFPNPSSGEIYVERALGNTNLDVQVFDNLGRLAKSYYHISERLTLLKKDFGNGIFIVNLQTEDGYIERRKIIFQ